MLRLFTCENVLSRNPLIWHRCNWAVAGLLYIMDYQTLHILTKFVTGRFLLLPSQPSEYVHLSVIFILLSKYYAFPTMLVPVIDFP
jgi:hypothetical protein